MAIDNTYVAIATQTLGSATTSLNFNSISGAYTDLVLIVTGSPTAATQGQFLQFNSDTSTNYSTTYIYGDGTSAASTRTSSQTGIQIGNLTSGVQHNTIVQIMNYSNTTTYKTALSRYNNTANSTGAQVGLWRSTAAITSITVYLNSSTFIAGSTFSLYGIKAA
jgi:hypothetical protein